MPKHVRAVPEGCHTVTPYLTVRGADRAVEFYKRAFGAKEQMRMPGPGGNGIMHAELKIGDSRVFLSDEFPDMGCRSPQSLGGTASSLHLYVKDVDAAFKKAVAAGAQVKMPVADMFWGDRYGKLIDPFGHEWGIATHKEDLTPQEISKRAKAFFAQMAKPQ
ncbi:MAG TPA: VOC family protein [Nitrospirales bacterium]|nr:VOC family protein [Nitrospirales bacterium]